MKCCTVLKTRKIDYRDFSDHVEYLEEFDMEFTQFALERKVYVKYHRHRDVFFKD